MPRKLTTKEFIEKAKKIYPQYDYSLVDYKNAQSTVKIICPNCGLKEIKATYILSGRGCSCEKHKYITNKITKPLDKEALEKKFPNFEFDYSTFKGNFSNIKIKCKICGNFFERNVNNLKNKNQGCPWCSGRAKTTEIIKEQLQEKYKDEMFDFSKVEYLGDERKQQIIICKKCKKEFMASTHDLLSKFGKKCPYCSRTIWKGEEKIKNWLEDNGFFLNKDYFREVKFKNLKGERNMPLRYDFYIPSKNLLIEYNGEQHYAPRKKFGDEKTFTKRKKYDKIKENYAIENKINLLIIPYWDFDKVEEILNENIKRKCE